MGNEMPLQFIQQEFIIQKELRNKLFTFFFSFFFLEVLFYVDIQTLLCTLGSDLLLFFFSNLTNSFEDLCFVLPADCYPDS